MAQRKRFEWKLRTRSFQLGDRTLVMGVLNVTPDSFSDGGRYDDPDRAFAQAIAMEEQGADIIDVGAESTRPGSSRVAEAEELRRLIPVLKRLRGKLSIPVSVDTYKSSVAVKALEHEVEIINDPSGLTFDPQVARECANGDAGLILNHMRGTPDTWAKLGPMKDPTGTIRTELDAAINRARRGGVDRQRIAIDPGIGFGKRREQNSEILARLGELGQLDRPLVIGASRKAFLAQGDEDGTEYASVAAAVAAILGGAHIVRVHDVRATVAAAKVADAIVASTGLNNVSEAAPHPRERRKPDDQHRRREQP